MEVIDEGWVACGRDVSSRSLPGRVSCGSVGLQRAVVVQQLQCRLNLSLGALSKDRRRSLCVGTTDNREKRFFCPNTKVNSTTEVLMPRGTGDLMPLNCKHRSDVQR